MNSEPNRWLRWSIVPLLVLCAGLLIWGHYRFLTTPIRYSRRDFMSLWSGGRALLEGLDPYDPDVWVPLRERYGSTWMPDERAPFPLWTFMLFVPFSSLSLDWGAASWLVFSECLLGLCTFLLLTQLGTRRPSAVEFALLLFGGFALRGTLLTLHVGQITLLLLLILTAFLVLVRRGRAFLAGFALAFLVLKPNPFLLFAPLIGLWLLSRRRWRVVVGGIAGGVSLLVASWLLQPGWLFGWLNVRGKTQVTYKTPTIWGLAYELAPGWWPVLGVLGAVLVVAGLGWLVLRHRELDVAQVVSLALCGSLFITPYAWAYEHALLLLPLLLIYARVETRWLAWLLWGFLVLLLPWFLYWVAIQLDRDTVSFLVPVLVGGAFYGLVCRRGGRTSPIAYRNLGEIGSEVS